MSTDGDRTGAAADDEAAFRAMFEATYRDLVGYARRRTDDWSDADDVVAEVFTIAWRRRAERDLTAPALPWLYGIAANVIRNSWRSSGRRLRLVDRLTAEPRPPGETDPADRPGAELREALAELSFDDQEVLRLVAWEGLSHAEVGTVLGCSTNAVGIRVHRARRRLADQLAEHGHAAAHPPATKTEPNPDTGDPKEETP